MGNYYIDFWNRFYWKFIGFSGVIISLLVAMGLVLTGYMGNVTVSVSVDENVLSDDSHAIK